MPDYGKYAKWIFKRKNTEREKMTVLRMLEAEKYVMEEIVNISGLPPEEVKKLKAERTI